MFVHVARVAACGVVASLPFVTPALSSDCAALAADPGLVREIENEPGFEAVLAALGVNCPQVLAMLDLPKPVIARFMPESEREAAEAVVERPVSVDPMLAKLQAASARLQQAVAAVDVARARVETAVGQVEVASRAGLVARMVRGLTVAEAVQKRRDALAELDAARTDLIGKMVALADAKVATAKVVSDALDKKTEAAAALAKFVGADPADDAQLMIAKMKDEATINTANLADALSAAEKKRTDMLAQATALAKQVDDAKASAAALEKDIEAAKAAVEVFKAQAQALAADKAARLASSQCDAACQDDFDDRIDTANANATSTENSISSLAESASAANKAAAIASAELDGINAAYSKANADAAAIADKKQQVVAQLAAIVAISDADKTATLAHQTAVSAAKAEIDAKELASADAGRRMTAAVEAATELATLSAEEKALIAELEAAQAELGVALDGAKAAAGEAQGVLGTVDEAAPTAVVEAARGLAGATDKATAAIGQGASAIEDAGAAIGRLNEAVQDVADALAPRPAS